MRPALIAGTAVVIAAVLAFALTRGGPGPGPGPGGTGPVPAGLYRCWIVPQYTYNGFVTLHEDGTYEAGRSEEAGPETSGGWSYVDGEGRVEWRGGSFEDSWPTTYFVEPGVYPDGSVREGTGSQQPTLALKVDESSPLLPGQETGGNPVYQYCYLG
jgi:hypothetical protein